MAVVFSFALDGAPSEDHDRLRSAFERLGWEHLGGDTYRYPALGAAGEDWMNHVVPALMLFRTHVTRRRIPVTRWSLDGAASATFVAGGNGDEPAGHEVLPSSRLELVETETAGFAKGKLRKWLTQADYPFGP